MSDREPRFVDRAHWYQVLAIVGPLIATMLGGTWYLSQALATNEEADMRRAAALSERVAIAEAQIQSFASVNARLDALTESIASLRVELAKTQKDK
jgi:hypothetical protein